MAAVDWPRERESKREERRGGGGGGGGETARNELVALWRAPGLCTRARVQASARVTPRRVSIDVVLKVPVLEYLLNEVQLGAVNHVY
eukprot:COSAG03_NODE_307_length_9149_cov_3.027293_7_plen_87_part_00